jgi:hypothetical protein
MINTIICPAGSHAEGGMPPPSLPGDRIKQLVPCQLSLTMGTGWLIWRVTDTGPGPA